MSRVLKVSKQQLILIRELVQNTMRNCSNSAEDYKNMDIVVAKCNKAINTPAKEEDQNE